MSELVHLALGQIERFRQRALFSSDDKMRSTYIAAADMIIFDLQACGAIEKEEAADLSRQWVEIYSTERLRRAGPDERLRALWRSDDLGAFVPRALKVEMIRQRSGA
jgi:hypothetical protein